MLNIATRKKNDRIANGSMLSPSATHVKTRTMVCAKPITNNKYPGYIMGLPTFSTVVFFKFNETKFL